ncbi:MAG: protoporphyrinogen/coproporphyrinogen oxidase [Actinomycetota bacterium]|jgi:oxygen-dependent protoporphyrinogen oxidase|nr:protoporphyrinogen/coproporphyrinogen oxidase [Actinomycetota bacterium]
MTTAVVVGGGISGLAGALALSDAGDDVIVLESSDRFGGKIRTTPFLGRPVDEGADAFLARVPHAVELSRRLGLGDDLVSPATGQASLWLDGVLKPIPAGLVLGVPAEFGPLAESGILSAEGLARAMEEPGLPGTPVTDDVTIGDLIRRRYGPEVHERLVDPLLGGINAGRTEALSLDVGAAQLAAVARTSASLTEGLRAQRRANPPDPSAPVFYAPRLGMASLVDALVDALGRAGAQLRTAAAVASIEPGYTVTTIDGEVVAADRVLVAAPAFVAAPLLAPLSPTAAAALASVAYASVTLVTLAYPTESVSRPIAGSGFLVPRTEGRLLTAGSVFSNKWPHLAEPDVVTVRASVGRHGDDRSLDWDDDTLVERVHAELAEVLGVSSRPAATRVSRWPASFPQFPAGHLHHVAAVEAALADDAPGLTLAGAYLRGVGIPACIGGAQAAADRLHRT